nr:hypothetical protein [Bacteroidota bacterium]
RYKVQPWDRAEITRYNFTDSDKFLDSVGIPADAKMLVIESYSTNIPLYMMNRRGYTVYQTSRDNAEYALFHTKWDYVVIQDAFLFSDVLRYYPIVSAALEPIRGNGKITLYKKNKAVKSISVSRFLSKSPENMMYQNIINFDEDKPDSHFDGLSSVQYSQALNSKIAVLDSTTEFGVAFHLSPNELPVKSDFKIHASWMIHGNIGADIQAVVSIINNGKTVYYQSYKLNDYYSSKKTKQKAFFEFVVPAFKNPNDALSIYLWNPSHSSLKYADMQVMVYK